MNVAKFLIVSDGMTIEVIDPKTRETTGPLTIGEAIEQLIGLLRPDYRAYPMKTKREWGAQRKRRQEQAKFNEPVRAS
jgi:hypothetical protein